jgi:uncharacterized membrane protein YkvA (DUF1232 family)
MESFWDIAKIVAILGAIFIVLVLILLAIPGSRLRKVFSVLYLAVAALLGVYVVSPIDFIPDFIPLLGLSDDAAASVIAVANAVAGIILYLKRRSSQPELQHKKRTSLDVKR